jgi:TonB family protein
MQRSMIRQLTRNSFWLSVLLHLLILLSIILAMFFQPEEEHKKPPNLYIPSFVYTGAIKPSQHSQSVRNPHAPSNQPITRSVNRARMTEQATAQDDTRQPQKITGKKSIVSTRSAPPPAETSIDRPRSILASSMAALKANQLEDISNNLSDTEPVLMIGDPNTPADPLIKLMARSLSTYFRYPDTEGMMGIKGRVLVKLTLHPEGYYTDVQLIKSSDNESLDAAALFAVNKAPKVIGADRFMQKPKRFMVGFVFY